MWDFISTISDLLLVSNIISSSISGVMEVPTGSRNSESIWQKKMTSGLVFTVRNHSLEIIQRCC
jgi:hypothetical protein